MIIVCYSIRLYKLTVMLTSMTNIVMNTTSQCSTILHIMITSSFMLIDTTTLGIVESIFEITL